MVLESPVFELRDNLIVTHSGDVWAYFKVHADNIAEGNHAQEEEKKEAIFHVLQDLTACEDVHFLLVPENMDLRERFSSLEDDFSPDVFNIAKSYANKIVKKLEQEMRVITRPAFYIGTKIRSVEHVENIREGITNTLDLFAKRLYEIRGYDVVMSKKEWAKVKLLEKEIYAKVKNLNATRITEAENVYLNRSQYIRGTKHDVKYESSVNHIKSITDAIIDPRQKGYLKLENQNGSAYTSMIVVDQFQPNMGYSHIFKVADKFKFPVELNVKVRFEKTEGEVNGMKAKFEGKRKRFRVRAQENISMQDSEGNRSKLNRALVKAGMDELEAGRTMVSWLAVFTVTGVNKEECKRRGDSVIQYLKGMKITAYRPTNNQLELFYMSLNGSSIVNYNKWIQTTSTETFGENLFAVANTVGNNVGWVIGRINQMLYANSPTEAILASKKLVLWNQVASNKNIKGSITASPHIAITGETGKGKSFLTKILFFYMTLMNSRVLYIDPKMEFRKEIEGLLNNSELVKLYPDYVQLIRKHHYISLNVKDKNNYGALDPIVFLTKDDAKDTASAMLKEILDREYTVDVELAINSALDNVIERRALGEKVGLMHVIERLEQSSEKEISQMGKLYRSKVTNTILELGFSNGETQGINLNNRINILEISGLELPQSENDNLTEINRQSIALMLPLGKFCEKFGADNKEQFSVEFFDEAWIFQKSQEGAIILEKMKRVGRSFNNTLVYTTQSVNDIESGEGGQFGQVFAFDSRSEREQILKHLDIEVNDRNIKRLATSTQGQCFYRDIYNHTDMITIDGMFDELMIAGKTVDVNESAKAEEKYA